MRRMSLYYYHIVHHILGPKHCVENLKRSVMEVHGTHEYTERVFCYFKYYAQNNMYKTFKYKADHRNMSWVAQA